MAVSLSVDSLANDLDAQFGRPHFHACELRCVIRPKR